MATITTAETFDALWQKSTADLSDSSIWDAKYHTLGSSVPANAGMFGLTIIDWDKNFKRRIRKFTVEDLQIPFQYIEQIPAWDKSANWNDSSDIMGRFEPMIAYSSSSAQELSLNLIYNAEAASKSTANTTPWDAESILEYINRLKSLVFPQQDGEYSPPVKLVLNIGSIFINVPVIAKQVQVTPEAPYDTDTLMARTYKVQLNLRIAYPTWQGLGASTVYLAKDNRVFAYRQMEETE